MEDEALRLLEEALVLLDGTSGPIDSTQDASLPPSIDDWDVDFPLELLDDQVIDFGVSETSIAAIPSETSRSSQLTTRETTRKKKTNPNKARDERRFQLIELQEEVAELEFTIQKLQYFKSKRPKTDNTTAKEDNEVPRVWQEICARQIARRLEAERENMRLKQQFEREKQLATSFKKLLYNRRVRRDAEPEGTQFTKRTDIPEGYVKKMAAMLFNELAVGVKLCYGKVGNIFNGQRSVPLDPMPRGPLLDRGVETRGEERKFYSRKTMPFGMRATGDAWWENWHNYRGNRFQGLAADEFVERFGLEMSDFKTNRSATAYAQQITQRHIEDDRIVVVWDAYVEPFGFNNERVGGVYLLEQNYVLIQPEYWSSERHGEKNGGCSTRVSTCYAITPNFLDSKLEEDPKTVAMIDFLVSAMTTTAMALTEMVENLLLDQALQQF